MHLSLVSVCSYSVYCLYLPSLLSVFSLPTDCTCTVPGSNYMRLACLQHLAHGPHLPAVCLDIAYWLYLSCFLFLPCLLSRLMSPPHCCGSLPCRRLQPCLQPLLYLAYCFRLAYYYLSSHSLMSLSCLLTVYTLLTVSTLAYSLYLACRPSLSYLLSASTLPTTFTFPTACLIIPWTARACS